MEFMKSSRRATKISLLLTLGLVYPLMVLADSLDWPAGVQLALAILALVVLVGTKVALTDWAAWRADRTRMRRERAALRTRR
jgi:hypothetical protein